MGRASRLLLLGLLACTAAIMAQAGPSRKPPPSPRRNRPPPKQSPPPEAPPPPPTFPGFISIEVSGFPVPEDTDGLNTACEDYGDLLATDFAADLGLSVREYYCSTMGRTGVRFEMEINDDSELTASLAFLNTVSKTAGAKKLADRMDIKCGKDGAGIKYPIAMRVMVLDPVTGLEIRTVSLIGKRNVPNTVYTQRLDPSQSGTAWCQVINSGEVLEQSPPEAPSPPPFPPSPLPPRPPSPKSPPPSPKPGRNRPPPAGRRRPPPASPEFPEPPSEPPPSPKRNRPPPRRRPPPKNSKL